MTGRIQWDATDTRLILVTSLLAALLRVAYVGLTELAPYDPWRHLMLVENLRLGNGFTLFEGQPYLWYQPPWYALCALFPRAIGPDWIAAVCSLLCVPLMYLLLRYELPQNGRYAATAAAVLVGCYGPLINFTCHYGPEAFALLLTLAAVVLVRARSDIPTSVVAGLLFGLAVVSRLNFAFNVFLLLPAIVPVRRGLALAAGIAAPLTLAWWRNHRILDGGEWLFTWDGLATPTADFNFLSTLVVQMHPDIGEGLRRLHDQILPAPEWTRLGGSLLFLVLATGCLLAARRGGPGLVFGVGLLYFMLFDATGTGRFYRAFLGFFPAMMIGIAMVAQRLYGLKPRIGGAALGSSLIAVALLAGAPALRPPTGPASILGMRVRVPLEMVTPPPELLGAERFMVNSTFYHPESLMYRFPERRFIGLPLRPERFEAFQRNFPEYRTVLWHDFSVQDDLLQYLIDSAGFRPVAEATNAHGRSYTVLERQTD